MLTTSARESQQAPDQIAALAGIPGVRRARDLASPQPVDPSAARSGATLPDEVLPVRPELAGLLPAHGLRRGTVAAVHGSNTLMWLMIVDAVRAGSWAAVVGMPKANLLAGLSLGVPSERLLIIPHPCAEIATVLAALLDAVDLVVVDSASIPPSLARTVANRARQRRRVVVAFGAWPGAELTVRTTDITWSGIEHRTDRHGTVHSSGRLAVQSLDIQVTGRGAAGQGSVGRLRLDWTAMSTAVTPKLELVSGALADRALGEAGSGTGSGEGGGHAVRRIATIA